MEDRYDIVVVGAGMAGIMAALAAKTDSNRVLIIEPSNVLGGQGTTGGVAGFCGDSERVNDYFEELVNRLSKYQLISDYDPTADRREYDLEWCAYFLQEMVLENGIDVLLHSRVIDAEVEGGRVSRLTVSTAGGILECHCGFVVDASGQCRVATLAGFEVIHEGANKQLPMSLYFTLWDTGKKVQPLLPPEAEVWENEEEIPMTSLHVFPSGKVEVKMKVVGFDAGDGFGRSQAEIHARRHMMSLIYFLQTKGYGDIKLDRHVLASVSRSIGIREEKRIVGEHILTEEEVSSGTVFPDAVAVGTYHFDFHWPDKMERAGTGITSMVEPYHIPLSCMIPKDAQNLLVTGRSACGDQMALSSFRVMGTVAQMGFGAGHAARLCVEDGCEVKSVDFGVLQSRISSGGQSLNLSNYGDYLRHSLVTHERIFGKQPPFKKCISPSLLQLKNNRMLLAWIGETGGEAGGWSVWVTERYQANWSEPRKVVDDQSFSSGKLKLRKDNESEVSLEIYSVEAEKVSQVLRMVSKDDGLSWTQLETIEVPESISDFDEQRSRAQTSGALVSAVVKSDDNEVEQTHLFLSASLDVGESWTAPIEIEKDPGIYSDPCLIATNRGVALVYCVNHSGPVFWHGSIEQMTDPDLVEWRDKVLHSGVVSMEA